MAFLSRYELEEKLGRPLKLLWIFKKKLNKYPGFEFDKDFIIKANLLLNDLGSRYTIDILRNEANIKMIKENCAICERYGQFISPRSPLGG